jgi:hypothetical protein
MVEELTRLLRRFSLPDHFVDAMGACMVVFIVLHPKRFMILRRLMIIFAALNLLRSFTVIITSLPDASPECAKQFTEKGKGGYKDQGLEEALSKSLKRAFLLVIQPGAHITCGDMVFSGHTCFITLVSIGGVGVGAQRRRPLVGRPNLSFKCGRARGRPEAEGGSGGLPPTSPLLARDTVASLRSLHSPRPSTWATGGGGGFGGSPPDVPLACPRHSAIFALASLAPPPLTFFRARTQAMNVFMTYCRGLRWDKTCVLIRAVVLLAWACGVVAIVGTKLHYTLDVRSTLTHHPNHASPKR